MRLRQRLQLGLGLVVVVYVRACMSSLLSRRAEVKSIKAPNGCYYIISCRTNSSRPTFKHIKWK